jgi:uncharacterized protein (TIGR02145 family)
MKTHTLNPIPHTLILAVIGVLTIFAITACGEKGGNTLKDPRDGKKYRTVKIGEQVWMAENLNYAADGSRCYDDKPENCDKYGRLYDWNTAMKACPSGWHLPNNAEWDKLYHFANGTNSTDDYYGNEVAGKYLKTKSGWNDYDKKSGNGTDEFGFSALPSGSGDSDVNFKWVGDDGYWWSSLKDSEYGAYGRRMCRCDERAFWFLSDNRALYSVRCIQGESKESDEPPKPLPEPVASGEAAAESDSWEEFRGDAEEDDISDIVIDSETISQAASFASKVFKYYISFPFLGESYKYTSISGNDENPYSKFQDLNQFVNQSSNDYGNIFMSVFVKLYRNRAEYLSNGNLEHYVKLLASLIPREKYVANGWDDMVCQLLIAYGDLAAKPSSFSQVYEVMNDGGTSHYNDILPFVRDKQLNAFIVKQKVAHYDDGEVSLSTVVWAYSFWGRRYNENPSSIEHIAAILRMLRDELYAQ